MSDFLEAVGLIGDIKVLLAVKDAKIAELIEKAVMVEASSKLLFDTLEKHLREQIAKEIEVIPHDDDSNYCHGIHIDGLSEDCDCVISVAAAIARGEDLESENFTCWKCERDTPPDEAYPYGLEMVCEGCSE